MISAFVARLIWPFPACVHQVIANRTGWTPQLTFDRQHQQASHYTWVRVDASQARPHG